ncbi:MAG: undecaprenyl-diphosphatase UppP [Candidatus Kerfeldbacteria bacterium RIFCSPLOWO2_01_FULL_48_11]|uniref:Undecaprenyl-diphosphatase n=1 Tax=Candidatus Kerfeldbacteria bacterium RIFCSPLOWO2_01_FULL_48_11 TaxID=1798543 RepID=A0A1G2B1K3_9BACT|nr:MAG: Undecaprenyl-diphosphatase [Parcubacteria group bacterium GW2011_GWA2_48_9]KKW16374.1 MAG: Undecaprenyl-diphosphatase [Parcubacteria group bacterium GW2011_GWC2_49_9]OGY83073.1 MAG: undecaprenyl-diphosphatase UppP [Candidatus Kerfeldbacteria bacterium RIFCSPLOWO2_01_FULL_48_11]HCM67570.1 undecaprenyl-diphosphatase UppP [Candidatus Kerfeldbacteria bacterium]
MFDILYSLLYGIVQAATEFFPVSSSGHLVLLHEVIHLDIADNLAFDVALHLGTLAALILVFWKDISNYSIAFFASFSKWNFTGDADQRLSWLIIAGTVPALVIGVLIAESADSLLRSPLLVATLLIGVGMLFFPVEKLSSKSRDLSALSLKDAIWIGIAQVLAFIPGVSRSGSTLLMGLGRGMTREAAARFSFLLAIPVIFIAGAKKMYDLFQAGIVSSEIGMLIAGFIASMVVGFAVIKYFLKFVKKHSLIPFAWYRIAVGLLTLVIIVVKFFST